MTNVSVTIDQGVRRGEQVLFEGAQGNPPGYRSRHLSLRHLVQHGIRQRLLRCRHRPYGHHGCLRYRQSLYHPGRGRAVPFVSELFDAIGDAIQKKGAEFGATTGRKRRCGWLDLVILRNAVRLNGLTGLVITKLDVLGGLEEIKVCTQYRYNNESFQEFPASLKVLAACEPVYEVLPGWKEDISGIRRFEDLPAETRPKLPPADREP